VVDSRNRRIQLYTSGGTFLRCFGAAPMVPLDKRDKNVFHYPRGIAFDHTGQFLYITDFNLHCIFRLDINCFHLEKFVDDGSLLRPSGIDVDSEGNVIVCDTKNHCLKTFYPSGELKGKLTSLGDSFDRFDNPLDVAVHPAGFYTALDCNGRVRIF